MRYFVLGTLAAMWACTAGAVHALPAEAPPSDRQFAVSARTLEFAGDADAVVRASALSFEVTGAGKAVRREKFVVTVLRPGGREFGQLSVGYDRLLQLASFAGHILDAEGRLVRELKKSEVQDFSAVADFSLFDDNRVRYAELYHDVYPYTVVWEFSVKHNGYVGWPSWYPQAHGLGVELASFEVSAPDGIEIRHRARGLSVDPLERLEGGRRTLRWELRDLPEFELEPYGPPRIEQLGVIHTAPDQFEMEGRAGRMQTWKQLGDWYLALGQSRDVLPDEAIREVRRVTDGVSSIWEKIRLLYAYLQERTRYVSIQLGIGGWQPMEAGYVHERGYGDCKALTNYMGALLSAAGIESHPVLIRNGVNDMAIIPDFPDNYFNHVILAVPVDEDTVWLETTSQTIPFGHIGSSNENRLALLVKPGESRLVRTIGGEAAENLRIRTGRVSITVAGAASLSLRLRYSGNQQDDLRRALIQRSPNERYAWLREELALPVGDAVADFAEVDARKPEIVLPITATLERQATSSGSRLFFRPAFLERPWSPPPEVQERRQPVRTSGYAFRDVDSLYFELPAPYVVEALPEPMELETSFGTYRSSVVPAGRDLLLYTRFMEIRQTTIDSSAYDDFRAFIRRLAQADAAQVVLVRP